MRHRVLAIPLLLLGLSAGAASGAWPQGMELAARGPRFIAAWKPTAEPADGSNAVILRRRVSLHLVKVTIDEALKEITRQADLEISYSRALLPPHASVSLQAREITVAAALTEVLLDAGVDVAVARTGHMALVKRPLSASVDPSRTDTGAVAGRVTDKALQTPLVGATVVIEGTRHTATTDFDGQYRIAGVPAGTYEVRARYIGYASSVISVTVASGMDVAIDFALDRSVQVLDEVVTTGTIIPTEVRALPSPITIINAEDIAASHPQSLLDVIRKAVPTAVAFDVPYLPAQTNFSARGTSSLTVGGQMKIFVDGVEATNYSFAPVDPNSIERIEVVRGPQAATLYGADAAGGVVQIFTKRGDPSLDRPQVQAQAELGVQQTPYDGRGGVLRQHYTSAVRGGNRSTTYNFGAGYTQLADYVPTDETSRQRTPSVYGGMRFIRGMLTADLTARYLHNELPPVRNPQALTSGFLPSSRPQYENQQFSNETYSTRISVAPTAWWQHQVTVGVDRHTTQFRQTQRRLTTPDDTLFSLSDGASRKISLGYNSSATGTLTGGVTGSMTVGLDHYDNDAKIASTSQALNTEGTIQTSPPGAFAYSSSSVTNTGFFAQAQVGILDALFLTAGLRADDNSAFGRDLSTPVFPRVGISVNRQFGQAVLKARASYGEGIRAPAPGLGVGSESPFGIQLENPLLRPERQSGWDAGIDIVFGERGSLSLTGFDQTAEDLIVFVTLAFDPVFTSQFQNIGRVKNSGVEVEGTLAIPPLELKARYGYVQSEIQALGPDVSEDADLQVGDQPLLGPKHTAGAALTITPRTGTTLLTGVDYVGSYRQYDFLAVNRCLGETGPCPESFLSAGSTRGFIIDYPGFAKLNATFTQQIGRHVAGFIAIDNLTNNEASEGGTLNPVLGRLTMVGFNVTY